VDHSTTEGKSPWPDKDQRLAKLLVERAQGWPEPAHNPLRELLHTLWKLCDDAERDEARNGRAGARSGGLTPVTDRWVA
jgi:hypothetical protein